MKSVKSFKEFINETYLDNTTDPELLDHSKKKMKKNGYIEVTIIQPVDGIKKGEKVLVSSTEYGELEGDSLVTCYKGDDEIIIPKKNLKVEI